VVSAQIWGRLTGWSYALVRLHKLPLFSSTPKNSCSRLSTSPIICNIPTCEKEKMFQLFSNNIGSFNTSYIFNVWNNFIVPDDRSDILAWLSQLDPKLRHRDIQDRRVESIGEWLLKTQEFRRWHAGSGEGGSGDAVLFCYGDPGVGKTYIK